jgi:hypothetical protein
LKECCETYNELYMKLKTKQTAGTVWRKSLRRKLPAGGEAKVGGAGLGGRAFCTGAGIENGAAAGGATAATVIEGGAGA